MLPAKPKRTDNVKIESLLCTKTWLSRFGVNRGSEGLAVNDVEPVPATYSSRNRLVTDGDELLAGAAWIGNGCAPDNIIQIPGQIMLINSKLVSASNP